MKRLFIVLIKYIPIIQMVGMLFNNILYCFSDIYIISYLLDFIIGNSITTTFLLYVCSYVFGFCKWHRFIITANIINFLIANLDAYYRIPISDIQLLIVYHFVAALFICISTYIHIKNNRDERKERKVIVDKVSTFVGEKLNEVLDSNLFSFIIKPYVSRVANNYIGKLDGLLKAIEDKDGKVDIEGILSESIDNLVVA